MFGDGFEQSTILCSGRGLTRGIVRHSWAEQSRYSWMRAKRSWWCSEGRWSFTVRGSGFTPRRSRSFAEEEKLIASGRATALRIKAMAAPADSRAVARNTERVELRAPALSHARRAGCWLPARCASHPTLWTEVMLQRPRQGYGRLSALSSRRDRRAPRREDMTKL